MSEINISAVIQNDLNKISVNDLKNISSEFENGTVVEAVVEESVNLDSYTLKFETGTVLSVNKSDIQGNVGDKIKFQVSKFEGGKVVLKQTQGLEENSLGETALKTEADYKMLLSKMDINVSEENLAYAKFLNENSIDVKVQNIKALKLVKEQVEYVSNNADEDALMKIQNSGLDVGKL